jgi:basic amino acid/polyamine antiporter, APA family
MAKRVELVRGLGFYGATSIVAGTMVGTAVFVVPGITLPDVRRPSSVLLAWVVAGLVSLFGALGYTELWSFYIFRPEGLS